MTYIRGVDSAVRSDGKIGAGLDFGARPAPSARSAADNGLARSFNGTSDYGTIDSIAGSAYDKTGAGCSLIMLLRSNVGEDDPGAIPLSLGEDASDPYILQTRVPTSGEHRYQVHNGTSVVCQADTTQVVQDDSWHLVQFSDVLNGSVGEIYTKVDDNAITGPDADTYSRMTWTPTLFTIGAWRRNTVSFFWKGEIAYMAYVMVDVVSANGDAIWNEYVAGGRNSLSAKIAELAGTDPLFAGALDGTTPDYGPAVSWSGTTLIEVSLPY